MVKKGKTYHILIPNIKMESYKIHVLYIIENHVIYRWYGKYKQWWHYEIEHIDLLQIKIDRAAEFKEKQKS